LEAEKITSFRLQRQVQQQERRQVQQRQQQVQLERQAQQQELQQQEQQRGLLFYRKRPEQQPTMLPTRVIFSWGIFL
jgi:hypothetical protein